jgi:ribonuclease HI
MLIAYDQPWNATTRPIYTLRHAKPAQSDLTKGMIACVKQRALQGCTTSFIKVKSHIGIVGNELADKIAKEAVTISPNAATARKSTHWHGPV